MRYDINYRLFSQVTMMYNGPRFFDLYPGRGGVVPVGNSEPIPHGVAKAGPSVAPNSSAADRSSPHVFAATAVDTRVAAAAPQQHVYTSQPSVVQATVQPQPGAPPPPAPQPPMHHDPAVPQPILSYTQHPLDVSK